MSNHGFQQINQQLRNFKKKSYEIHTQQKTSFKKLLQSGIQINFKDPKIGRMIQMGIPSIYRNVIWQKMIENIHGINLKFYHLLLTKATNYMSLRETEVAPDKQKLIKQLNSIQIDIERTFPQLKLFKKQSQQGQSLFNVLAAWTVFREDIGYIQGMSQIVGLLLVQLSQNETFPIFASILTTDTLYAYYSMDPQEMQKFEHAFDLRIKWGNNQIFNHFKNLEIQSRGYLLSWILTLFTRIMSPDLVSQLWDILLLHELDQKIMIEVCYFLVISQQKRILDKRLQPQQVLQVLKGLKLNQIEAEKVMNNIRNSHI